MVSEQGIRDGKTTIGIIGLGYVGLPLMMEFARAGFAVTGFDTDEKKIDALNSGRSYITYIPSEDVARLRAAKKLSATGDLRALSQVDAVIICVPTPLTERKEPDLRYVEQTSRTISRHLQKGQLIVLESTTYPGTTDELVLPILEESGLKVGQSDFYLAYSPERVDPGNEKFPLSKVPKVVGGINAESTKLAALLYDRIVERTVPVTSPREAEMCKLLENIYRSVNIALVNEMKLLCLRMGIDVWEVIRAASTKPYGFSTFYPGPGLGGHCIPIDPFYLAWKAKEYDLSMRFIELAGEVNTAMPYHVVDAIGRALNENERSIRGSKILLLGMAYKKNVDDVRESPALKIMELLLERGGEVDYNDPYVPQLHKMRKWDFSHLSSVAMDGGRLAGYNCVVIVTDHDCYDFEKLVREATLVVDTRNATRNVKSGREKIRCC